MLIIIQAWAGLALACATPELSFNLRRIPCRIQVSTRVDRFLKSVAATSAAPALATAVAADDVHELKPTVEPPKAGGPNDRIRIATIGMGIIGFIDTETALKVPGVELVAASDVYEGRRTHAKEVFGDKVETYVDYREILARKDVDAVLICVPDHWHARMSIDAMKAGKAVYCEKPMIRGVEEGPGRHRRPEGDQGRLPGRQPVRQLDPLRQGQGADPHRGRSARCTPSRRGTTATRTSAPGSTRSRPTPRPRRSTGTASWATRRSGRSTRCGSSAGGTTGTTARPSPATCSSTCSPASTTPPARSGRRGSPRWAASAYWNDGRDVYDIIMGLLDYPETDAHGSFTLSLVTDFEDGGGGATAFRFVGTEGVIDVSFRELTLTRVGIEHASADQVLKGYNSVKTFSNAQQKAFAEKYLAEHPELGGEAPVEGDGEVRRAQGLRRAVRPLRQLLHVGPRQASPCTKTRPSATAPPPRPCSATRATGKSARSTGTRSP